MDQLLALRLLEAGLTLPQPSTAQLMRCGLVIWLLITAVGTIASALSALVLWVPIHCGWCRAMGECVGGQRPRRRYDNVGVLDASIRVAACESVAVLGRSGSGKSTLVAMLAGLCRPQSGNSDAAHRSTL